jgi:hypothetical protein
MLTVLLSLWCFVCMAANITWEGDDSADWNTGTNWAGDAKPGGSDVAVFDGATASTNCLLDSDESIAGISVEADYEGTIDLGDTTQTLTIGSSGAVIAGHANSTFDLGDSTVAVAGGQWTTVNHAGTWTRDTSTVTFSGTSTIDTGVTNNFQHLSVTGGTATSTNSTETNGTVTLDGTLLVDSDKLFFVSGVSTLIINAAGRLGGDGMLILPFLASGEGITTFHGDGTFDIAMCRIQNPSPGAVLAPGDYQSAVKIDSTGASARVLELSSAGVYQFASLELETTGAGTLTLANDVNGPTSITVNGNLVFDKDSTGEIIVDGSGKGTNWVITGDVVDEGAATWTKGTGTITASGGGAQNWDWGNVTGTLEGIVVNSSGGTLTLADDFTCESWTHSDGTVDYNSKTLTTTGAFTLSAGADGLAANLPNAEFLVGGAFSATGTDAGNKLDMAAASGWTLTVTGTGSASFVDAAYSDASAGSAIWAIDSTDSGNNQKWNFPAGNNPNAVKVDMRRKRPGPRFVSPLGMGL